MKESYRKKNEMKDLYSKLPEALLSWYKEHARDLPWRKTKEPYAVWVSEIMLQQTRVETVKGYYERFMNALPTIGDLAQVDEEKLLKLWEGLGYYSRVRNLQKAAKWILEENNGVFPSEYQEILALPGIGEYTAGAIASNCFNQPIAAVDGNVLRVVTRITEDDSDIMKASTKGKIKAALEEIYPVEACGDFTQSLIELGAIVCLPAGPPKCDVCPAQDFCRAYKKGTMDQFPVKIKKLQRKIEDRTVFLLNCNGHIAIQRRPVSGLLAGLWELPNAGEAQTAQEAVEMVKNWGCYPIEVEWQQKRKHIFSHIEWHMVCYHIKCGKKATAFEWVKEDTLHEEVALPTAFKQFFTAD